MRCVRNRFDRKLLPILLEDEVVDKMELSSRVVVRIVVPNEEEAVVAVIHNTAPPW